MIVFSVVGLFVLFFLVPLIFLKRPEAWLLAMLIGIMVEPVFLTRMLNGRPLMVTISALIFLLFAWDKFKSKPSWRLYLSITLAIAAATWIHSSWYLFTLVIACLLIGRKWQAALRLSVCFFAGVLLGALCTGHPAAFIFGVVQHGADVFKGSVGNFALVKELQAGAGNPLAPVAVAIMLGWRALRNQWDKACLNNPVFILAVLGWILGFAVVRFWYDWGLPALLVWLAQELEPVLEDKLAYLSPRRILVTTLAAMTLFLAVSGDANNRWSFNTTKTYAQNKQWLPDPGGILYSIDMRIFYNTFYNHPDGQWRYILGFESTMMPPEDLETYRNILRLNNAAAYGPWVKKMTPLDRLVILSQSGTPPQISGLEWYNLADLWVGRKRL